MLFDPKTEKKAFYTHESYIYFFLPGMVDHTHTVSKLDASGRDMNIGFPTKLLLGLDL